MMKRLSVGVCVCLCARVCRFVFLYLYLSTTEASFVCNYTVDILECTKQVFYVMVAMILDSSFSLTDIRFLSYFTPKDKITTLQPIGKKINT